MATPRSTAGVRKQLDTVADKLADEKVRGKQRLALLRRQAQLGDERDQAALLARRAESPR